MPPSSKKVSDTIAVLVMARQNAALVLESMAKGNMGDVVEKCRDPDQLGFIVVQGVVCGARTSMSRWAIQDVPRECSNRVCSADGKTR